MRTFFLIILFILAFSERVFLDLGPNIELVTMALLLSAAYVGQKQSFWLVFVLMATTDLILGNSNIFIFTWSGFLIPALILGRTFKTIKSTGIKKVGMGTVGGIGANLFFYFWTNFGVWFLGSMYPKTLEGLATSYINALPFLKMQLTSTLIFVPIGFLILEALLGTIYIGSLNSSRSKKFQPL